MHLSRLAISLMFSCISKHLKLYERSHQQVYQIPGRNDLKSRVAARLSQGTYPIFQTQVHIVAEIQRR
jgi:hypothetical protein